jgi:hypothetical protein
MSHPLRWRVTRPFVGIGPIFSGVSSHGGVKAPLLGRHSRASAPWPQPLIDVTSIDARVAPSDRVIENFFRLGFSLPW